MLGTRRGGHSVSWRGAVLRRLLSRIAVDITPARESRDLRLLLGGELITGIGTQAALVALPYQLYVETGSAFLTGLLGAGELMPLMALALLRGARGAGRPARPAAAAAPRPGRAGGLRPGARRARAHGIAPGPAAVPPRRRAGRI